MVGNSISPIRFYSHKRGAGVSLQGFLPDTISKTFKAQISAGRSPVSIPKLIMSFQGCGISFKDKSYLYNVNAETFSIDNEKLQLWSVGLSLNWDLWNWGYTSSKSEQAEQEMLQNKESLELLKDQIEIEVYNAYLVLNSQIEKIRVSQLAVASAEENSRITKDKYDNQLATTSDLIEAEVELLNSKSRLTISQADYELAKARLDLTVGRRIY